MVPADVKMPSFSKDRDDSANMMGAFACGDLIADFISQYRQQTGKKFFETYIQAIYDNQRLDEKDKDKSLIIIEDENVMLFVPKAQTSQWEIQLMTRRPVGNILEADLKTRQSIDHAILSAVQILEKMGAKMITSIEYSKSFDSDNDDQRLLYAFLPRLPESPGAFSEAQLRWINGHYPEDFAAACRMKNVNQMNEK
jgi:sugar/nucleoside kinase (ribokinase family)